MEIREVAISKLNPAKYNPRKDLKPGDPEYIQLEKSIKEFGNVDPIIWNEQTGNIVGGHQRFKVLSNGKNGNSKLTVSVVKLPEQKEKMLNIALNKISGDWDLPKLEDLIGELNIDGFDLDLIGFDNDELSNMFDLEPKHGLTDDDAIPEVDEEPITKPGDFYSLGNHRLLCGDATIGKDVERLMDCHKADMVLTDPPYGVDYSGQAVSSGKFIKEKRHKIKNDSKDAGWLYESSLSNMIKCCDSKAAFYVFYADGKYSISTLAALEKAGLRIMRILIWHKINIGFGSLNQRYKQNHEPIAYCANGKNAANWYGPTNETTVWSMERKGIDGSIHPTMKPIAILERAIANSSKQNNIVCDIFSGSGSTLIACEKTDRICYGMEIEPHYCDVIVKRWEDYTGKKAELCK